MTSNYLERMTMSDSNHIINMIDPLVVLIGTPRIDSRCSLEKEFIQLISMNPFMVLNLTIN